MFFELISPPLIPSMLVIFLLGKFIFIQLKISSILNVFVSDFDSEIENSQRNGIYIFEV